MFGLLTRIATTARNLNASCAEQLESRGIPVESYAGPSNIVHRPQTLVIPPPPSIFDDLLALDISRDCANELHECFTASALKLRSLACRSYERLDAKLRTTPALDPTSQAKLYEAILSFYNRKVSLLREDLLDSARRDARRASSDKAPFQPEVSRILCRCPRFLNFV
jgi:hypothetical protein